MLVNSFIEYSNDALIWGPYTLCWTFSVFVLEEESCLGDDDYDDDNISSDDDDYNHKVCESEVSDDDSLFSSLPLAIFKGF